MKLEQMDKEKKPRDLSQAVYDYMVEQIKSGELIEQQRITEYMIVKRLGVSRTPVRKAFRALAEDGYLENIENVGVHVKRQSFDKRGFQERAEFLEKLFAYYLFELERKEVRFDESQLEVVIQTMQNQLTENSKSFEESCVAYFRYLLEEISNSYMKTAMIKALQELFLKNDHFQRILKNSRRKIYESLITLSDQLAVDNYPMARREIRILLNQMKLDVIEKS